MPDVFLCIVIKKIKQVYSYNNNYYSNFKLKSSLFEKTPNQWIIIIPIKQEVSLKEIVMPYMHYTFLYKL